MVVNRITKYLKSRGLDQERPVEAEPEQPTINLSAFAGLPLATMPFFGAPPAPAQPPAALNIYAIARAEAEQRLSRPKLADLDFGDF